MHPQEYYQSILAMINDDLERGVFEELYRHIGEAVLRTDLILCLFQQTVDSGKLASNPHDRAIRKCVENLRGRGFPIVSSSGEAGYCLTDDLEVIDHCIAEYRSRVQKMEQSINRLLMSRSMAQDLRRWRRGRDLPVQARMF